LRDDIIFGDDKARAAFRNYWKGGGAGMLMQAQSVYDTHKAVTGGRPVRTGYETAAKGWWS